MAINSDDLLMQAEHCANSDTEAGYRSSVSRAYYALYHEALSFAEIRGFKHSGPSKHAALADFLGKIDNRFADRMRVVLKKRVSADYFLHAGFRKIDASQTINECRKLVERVQKHSSREKAT